MAYKSLVGQTFHFLTILEDVGRTNNGTVLYKCICECGKNTIVNANSLRQGTVKSCGCWRAKNMSNLFTTHGLSGTRIYKIWMGMVDRCYNEGHTSYARYGHLGIRVCDKWRTFEGFYEDMKEGYSDELTIERIVSSGNYEKSNCKWATYQEQNENKKNTRFLTVTGETKKLVEWGRISGIGSRIIRLRLDYYGWDAHAAVFTPSRNKNGRNVTRK